MSAPIYQVMPNLTIEEYEDLRESIRTHGVLVPIEVDERGDILDGHHRAAACDELGITYPTVVREGLDENAKLRHVLTLNLDRRHLTRDQRADLVGRLRQRGMSLRAIADVVKVPKSTVADDLAPVRTRTPDPEFITGRDGKTYPATSATSATSATEERPEEESIAEFDTLSAVADAVEGLGRVKPSSLAAAVPHRRRLTTAKRLRRLGRVLGDIAWCLETMERQGDG